MNSSTLDTTAHKSKPAGWLYKAMTITLATYLCFLNWDMFRRSFAESAVAFPELVAIIGLITLDIGAWNWKNVRARWADSEEQETLASWMAWTDLGLAIVAGVVHQAQLLNMMTLPAWTGYLVTVILGAATALNVVAAFAFGMLDPAFQQKQRSRRVARIYRDRTTANLEKLALAHADEDAEQAAAEIFAAERSAWRHANTTKPGAREHAGGGESTRQLNATVTREEVATRPS